MQVVCWSPADILPDSDLTVMVHCPGGDDPVCPGFHDGEQWHDYNGAPLTGRDAVTHWMPFPEPPSELQKMVKERHSSFGPPGFCGNAPPCKGSVEGKGGCIFDCVYNEFF